MIDWITSKLGLLIFLTVAVGSLFSFGMIQVGIFKQSTIVEETNNIARLIDGLCDGCSVGYEFEQKHDIILAKNKIKIDNIERQFISNIVPTTLKSIQKVKIENIKNLVKISGI